MLAIRHVSWQNPTCSIYSQCTLNSCFSTVGQAWATVHIWNRTIFAHIIDILLESWTFATWISMELVCYVGVVSGPCVRSWPFGILGFTHFCASLKQWVLALDWSWSDKLIIMYFLTCLCVYWWWGQRVGGALEWVRVFSRASKLVLWGIVKQFGIIELQKQTSCLVPWYKAGMHFWHWMFLSQSELVVISQELVNEQVQCFFFLFFFPGF